MTTTTINPVTLGWLRISRAHLATIIGFLDMDFQNFAGDSLSPFLNGLVRSTTKLLPEERQLCEAKITALEKSVCDLVALQAIAPWHTAKNQIKEKLEQEMAPTLDEILKAFGDT